MDVQDYFTDLIAGIENISIHDVCESLLNDSRDKETMICEESSVDQPQIPLVRSPIHKRDHSKLSWTTKNNPAQKSLMSQPCPLQNQYLNNYLHLLNEKDPNTRFPFKFTKIYPHTLNLCAQQRFYQGEIITQISPNYFISLPEFQSTHVGCYLSTLKMNIQSNKNIFVPLLPADREIMKRNVQNALQELHLLYVFQHKFVTEIESTIVTEEKEQDRWAYAQWLYFQLLPKDFDYMPMNHIALVKKHHGLIAECLESYREAVVRSFHNIRNILQGKNIKKQYHFQYFLKHNYQNSEQILQKYQQNFTLANFLWSKSCERSRIYYNQQHSNNLRIYQPHTFLPILDLFHHSYQHANVTWTIGSQGLIISAKRQIEKGELLYVCYNSMPIQTQFIHSGFVDVESECYLDIPIFYNPNIIFDILQYTRNRNFQKKKEWILWRSKVEYQYVSLSINSVFQNEDIKSIMRKMTKECYQKMMNIADCIGKEIENFKECPAIERGKPQNRKRSIKAKIRKDIKEAISLDASVKRTKIKQLQKDLRNPPTQLTFNEEYNLMCINTILHSELKLLQSMSQALSPYY